MNNLKKPIRSAACWSTEPSCREVDYQVTPTTSALNPDLNKFTADPIDTSIAPSPPNRNLRARVPSARCIRGSPKLSGACPICGMALEQGM